MSDDKLQVHTPEDLQDRDGRMVCLSLVDGRIPQSAAPGSIKGTCVQCGEGIFHSATAPTQLKKYCRACTLAAIEAQGEEFDWAVMEQSVQEALRYFGFEDTPEVRARILNVQKEQFIRFLREGAAKQRQHKHNTNYWE